VQDLTGKVAFVTGAASGIGRAIAMMLAAHGASVGVCDLNESASRKVVTEIEQGEGRALALQVDVSNSDRVRAAMQTTVEKFGRMDILVNNAGLQFIAPVHEFPEEKWNLLIGVMLTGTFLCTKYALPSMMAKRWGRIINISSIHGLIASPFKSAYIAAKHGIIGLTKTVALEVAEYGITANAICPSYVRTPLVEGQIAEQSKVHGIPQAEVVEKIMLAQAAVKRLLEPEEIAGLVLYLCSAGAAGVTGAAYTIDGGWTAR
jgi:3-hydroxybutyrate dehydrogenase